MTENIEQNEHNVSGNKPKRLTLRYFAILREQSGLSEEKIESNALTALALYAEISKRFSFTLPADLIRVAVNDGFEDMQKILQDGDVIVFIPPVAGG